jgi:Flp pilus assembly protein TadG
MPKPFTRTEELLLRTLSEARTPMREIMQLTGRTAGALRQRAWKLGISLGHRKRRKKGSLAVAWLTISIRIASLSSFPFTVPSVARGILIGAFPRGSIHDFVPGYFTRKVHSFAPAEGGNVAMMFAVMLPVLLTSVGAAIDYSRAANARSAMQAAVDATALMISKEASNTVDQAALKDKAYAYFNALYNRSDAAVSKEAFNFVYSANSGSGASVQIDVSGSMPTDFMKVANITTMPLNVSSTTKWGNMRYRVALALDNTGSMASDDKMGQLKIATKKLIEDFYAMAGSNDDVYISIVPFAKGVNVGTTNSNASWLRWDKLAGETVIDTAWEAEPPVMSTWLANSSNMTTWEQAGPGGSCPFSIRRTDFAARQPQLAQR